MSVKFLATKAEFKIIQKVAMRVQKVSIDAGIQYPRADIIMDLEACHCNGNRLDLKRLLEFDDFNFAHDVLGIRRHLDRETGKLTDFFLPRCTYQAKGEG